MAFSLPGAIAAKLVHPERRVLAAMGDGAFLMSVAEIETAVREGVAISMLVWVDGGYGLIGWKQDIHFGRRAAVAFGNPDFVQLAAELRRDGLRDRRRRRAAAHPPRSALADDARPVDRVPGRLHREREARRAARASSSDRCDRAGRGAAGPADPPEHVAARVGARRRRRSAFSVLLIIGCARRRDDHPGDDWSSGIVWATAFAAAAFGAAGIGRWMDGPAAGPGSSRGYVLDRAGGGGRRRLHRGGLLPGPAGEHRPLRRRDRGRRPGARRGGRHVRARPRGRAIGVSARRGHVGAVGSPLLVAALQGWAEGAGRDPDVVPWARADRRPVAAAISLSRSGPTRATWPT